MEKTAILMTVFNRREKTLSCLKSLFALKGWSDETFDVYIVDGGSSDGTLQAVASEYPGAHPVSCDGLYWAGGMRKAWDMAEESGKYYSRYMLVNDDTVLFPEALEILEDAEKAFPGGVYVGATQDPLTGECSYGGRKLLRKAFERSAVCPPCGRPQLIDMGNANIMVVSRNAYDSIGGFCEFYTHGIADYDYTLTASKAGLPVVLASDYCGKCPDDHGDSWKGQNVPLRERIEYLYSPKGLAYKEYMYYIRKFFPSDVLPHVLKLWFKTLFPFLWTIKKKVNG